MVTLERPKNGKKTKNNKICKCVNWKNKKTETQQFSKTVVIL